MRFVYFLVVNNNKYLAHVADNVIFAFSVPDYPSRIGDNNSLQYFGISVYFVHFIFI